MIGAKGMFIFTFIIFLLMVNIFNYAAAFGVSYSYLCPQNPVRVYPGQKTSVELGMQNMNVLEGDDKNVIVNFKDDAGIAVLEENRYLVEANTKDAKVDVLLNIPKDAEIGASYNVVLFFNLENKENSQGVLFSVGNEVKICIEVESRDILLSADEEKGRGGRMNLILIVLGILVLIILIAIVSLRKKKKTKFVSRNWTRWK